jgi:hypothetical protein
MPSYKIPDQMEWTNPPRDYYLSDVKEKVLYHDPETGFKIALIKAPVGVMDKLHKHSEANQFVFALTGDRKWTFSYTPKSEVHGGSDIKEEVVGLFIWDGPPTPEVQE